jgi:exopolyphosphatase/pppGpp-phosphohydrolase
MVAQNYNANAYFGATDYDQRGATEGTFTGQDLNQFQQLLNRLTSSKMTQQKQKSKEGRKDIYAGGLASMMSNF